MRVSGYLVRLGAEIRVNVQALQMISASCDKDGVPADNSAPMAPPPPQQPVVAPQPAPARPLTQTVWSGIYSDAQAYSGEKVADTTCQGCHSKSHRRLSEAVIQFAVAAVYDRRNLLN